MINVNICSMRRPRKAREDLEIMVKHIKESWVKQSLNTDDANEQILTKTKRTIKSMKNGTFNNTDASSIEGKKKEKQISLEEKKIPRVQNHRDRIETIRSLKASGQPHLATTFKPELLYFLTETKVIMPVPTQQPAGTKYTIHQFTAKRHRYPPKFYRKQLRITIICLRITKRLTK